MRMSFFVKNKVQRTKLLIILVLAFALLATTAALVNKGKNGSVASEVFYPIKGISTQENIYTVTANLTGSEKDKDIELLLSVCNGLGIKVTFFVEPDWLNDNEDLASEIQKTSAIGLLINKNLNGKSRNSVMQYIAGCNDDFFAASGKYPKYVRISGTPDQNVTQVLNAYGQYCVSYQSALTEDTSAAIKKGCIADIGVINDKSGYILAQSVSAAIKNSLTCIEMEKFLYKIGSETDEFGTQYT